MSNKLTKEEVNIKKAYLKELEDFRKADKIPAKKRVKEVKAWYASVEKTKLNKSLYKTKLNDAKQPLFHYDGDISLENVSYTYNPNSPFEFKALDETSVTFKKGIITAVIGTTGSGKSTLIQLTNGLIITDTGRTKVGDYQIPAGTKKISEIKKLRKEVGLVFQFPEYQLFEETIEKDISFGPINLGDNKQLSIQKVPELLEIVGLPKEYLKRSPFGLSGGQKRRVAIAGIIAMDGGTLVLDEPTGGLDPKGEEDFMSLFKRLNVENGKRIIIVTHNMDHVLQIADEVVVMEKGKVALIGKPNEIFKNEELLERLSIEPPKLYQLAYKLAKKGINILDKEFKTVKELVEEVKKVLKK
ncbi:energy-coupling factor transporter ATPase [Spiroplasma endosymbiont of Crioceris asparagi]|uniref:energy-coupling factor transporter ATPase n=1 Tax=Spiroplasma endosymbiont of Crioceris asparagi TaxID=3066286 RepID=UPI0030D3541C